MFIFKLLFAVIGFRFFKMPGLLLGVLIGHAFDAGVSHKIRLRMFRKQMTKRAQAEADEIFMLSTFTMFAKLIKADGAVSREEIAAVQSIMTDVFGFKKRIKKRAIKIFNNGKDSPTTFQACAADFHRVFHAQPAVLETMIDLLLRIAVSDKDLNESEDATIRAAAAIFGISDEHYHQLRSRYVSVDQHGQKSYRDQSSKSTVKGIEDHYATLGCTRDDSTEVIKKQYRKLVREYHPDNIASKDLPEGFTTFANEKFQTIHEAYQAIVAERGVTDP